ncbi:uncharacterized protein LOC106165176 [Lingula anatina]|uniref:Uncharacterized protein LOC106165176 n=1 Tax=Lingula anatina TaxID=7574 RepID=A0A1S3IKG3_LINAN|nr:uncharacterized protein LOC106165176 [Lingula anatina]|eukprot:XP_013398735.1 uncharacterized protein LOC106165176 [Lingula anatina]
MDSVRVIVCVLALVVCVSAGYNHSCPKVPDIQTSFVATQFNLNKFQGIWYELAYHDYTQPIGRCRCQRANKVYKPEEGKLYDYFSLYCVNHTYVNNLSFKITNVTGYFEGHWPILPSVVFPDTVVALQVGKDGNYEWVIEFQCVEVLGRIDFVGINFYHRRNNVTKDELEGMFKVARQQGLGEYMDYGPKVTIVDHRNCVYPK